MAIPRPIVGGLVVNISSLVCAIAMGWTSSMIPKLTTLGPDNPLDTHLSVEEITWIGSCLAIGGVLSAVLGGLLADKIGRKRTLLGNALLFIASFAILGVRPDLTQILIARVLQGFGVGISMTVQSMYIGEISTDNLRGALGSFMNLFMAIGFLVMNSVGSLNLPFLAVQRILIAFPCAFIVLFAFMPESPYYYMAKQNRELALKSLAYLHDKPTHDQTLIRELEKIEQNVISSKVGDSSKLQELSKRANMKALTICGVLIACQQLSGINGVFFYAGSIFDESGLSIDADLAVILLCTCQLFASAIVPFLADRCGRKVLLYISSSLSALFLLSFGVYKYGVEHEVASLSNLKWLPITSLIGYLLAFSCGLACMPWAIISEIFPPNTKSIATAIMTCIAWSCTFLVTKFFQPLSLAIGSYSVFGIFAGFASLAFFFTLFFVFETKGLSLMEVQQKLQQQK